MPQCPAYATTVIGAHSVYRWCEVRDVALSGGINERQRGKEARKRNPTLKVLLTLGYAPNASVRECRLGCRFELRSPFTQAALSGKLRDIIDSRSTPARVLVVEDEALVQVLEREYLQECALEVDLASIAAEALNNLRLVPGGSDCMASVWAFPQQGGQLGPRSAIHRLTG
jgi:hypothetical protein